jgi:secreted PhoX family phosphatase
MQAPDDPDRRVVLKSGVATVVALMSGGCAATLPFADAPHLPGFVPVPPSAADSVVVPAGYEAALLYKWGDPTGIPGAMPAWRPDASTSAADQALQAGMHHDGMHFFPLARDGQRGLLVLNHEYTDEALLHADGAHGANPAGAGAQITARHGGVGH